MFTHDDPIRGTVMSGNVAGQVPVRRLSLAKLDLILIRGADFRA
jgi:hypothetical protein